MSNYGEEAPRILVVDDSYNNVRVLEVMLEEGGFNCFSTVDSREAVNLARGVNPDLILLDIMMPEPNGFTICEALKADEGLHEIPVIFISALDDVPDKIRAFQVGGVDYITKPFKVQEVLVRVRTHIDLRLKQREIEHLHQKEREHLQRMNDLKDDVLRMVSYDLKSPLSSILSGIYLLNTLFTSTPPDITERGQRYVALIENGAEKMKNLITDVLDMAAAESEPQADRQAVRLFDLLNRSLTAMEASAKQKDIELSLAIEDPQLEAKVAADRFQHVLHNLLSNALKYTPEGGVVEIGGEKNANGTHIWVRDTGIGIPAELVPRIFDKFYRVPKDEHLREVGTGLGLAIVKAIVEQHEGQINVESQEGVGTSFHILLPG